jgi:hypothetical protein
MHEIESRLQIHPTAAGQEKMSHGIRTQESKFKKYII